MLALLVAFPPSAWADGPLDWLKAGRHKQLKQEFHTKEIHHGPPYDLTQLASMVDIVEEGILDDGTIVIKRPDVWSQARMTKYRVEFEEQMKKSMDEFAAVISARVARADRASFENATSLGVALAGSGGGGRRGGSNAVVAPQLKSEGDTDFNKNQIELFKAQNQALKEQTEAQTKLVEAESAARKAILDQAQAAAAQNVGLLTPASGTAANLTLSSPFTLLGSQGAFQNFSPKIGEGKLGLEPTILMDEKKRYLDHINQIRRVNLGDDNADTAGYSLTLVRMPASIQPGDRTKKGHGAVLTLTARPEFRADFLPTTFRSLVVQDLVDQLTPILYEILDRRIDVEYMEILRGIEQSEKELAKVEPDRAAEKAKNDGINEQIASRINGITANAEAAKATDILDELFTYSMHKNDKSIAYGTDEVNNLIQDVDSLEEKKGYKAQNRAIVLQKQLEDRRARLTNSLADARQKLTHTRIPANRLASRPYPVAPTDMEKVFFQSSLIPLANTLRLSQSTEAPRAAEIRAFLSQLAEPAFALMPYYESMIPTIAEAVHKHAYNQLPRHYMRLARSLPNELAGRTGDPVTFLCWSIAVDAGMLDLRLKEEMKRLNGQAGFCAGDEVDGFLFYLTNPQPGARETFQAFVNTRWPIICFALDPVTDQQNIADAVSTRRDTMLAASFAFATGKINFSQFNRFRRQIEFDAETIALNRTVTAFAHGNETFGWRFYPRYQNPPQEANNFTVVANQLLRGGPGRDYQIKNSQLEAGQRELTAVVIMPSFLPRVRFEVASNWFPLTQPDDLAIPTSRMVWQGQEVMKLRHAVTHLCDPRQSRPGDLERVLAKIDRVEQMLPMQTEIVNIPYENAQGGFDLFTPGLASLVPELFGYDGIDLVDTSKSASFFVFGKNLSIHETKVVAGGLALGDGAGGVEILSREVMRVTVPANALATALSDRTGKDYLEVIASTPNGISNRLTIPIRKAAATATAPPAAAKTGYSWATPPSTVVYARYGADGRIEALDFEDQPEALAVNASPAFPGDAASAIPNSLTHLVMRLKFKDKDGKDVAMDTTATRPDASFAPQGDSLRATIREADEHLREPIRARLASKTTGLAESRFAKELDVTVETYILVDQKAPAIKLDESFTIKLKVREEAPPATEVQPGAEGVVPIPPAPGLGTTATSPFSPVPTPPGR